ncbi:MAG: flagellar biosynthetic protein FliO [Proteobacteria bacterium]|nr:flagellar biosynthetic protein FliO [Pseudomonadota bacterium]
MNGLTSTPLISGSDFWIMIFKSLGMLCLVLGILVGILYFIRKINQAQGEGRDKSMIRHLSTFYLAPKERVVLLDVMGRKILIGVTQQNITNITEFPECLEKEDEEEPRPFFKTILRKAAKESHPLVMDDLAMIQKAEA